MRSIVATRSFLAEVTLDHEWRLADFRLVARGQHYGLALPGTGGDRVLVMQKRANVLRRYERDHDAGDEAPYRWTDDIRLPGRCDDTHQVAWQDGGLYVANSGFNTIDYMPLDGRAPQSLCFDDHGSRHVNSVFPCGNKLAIVMLHNKGSKTSEVAVVRRGEAGIELVNRMPVWDMGCHNVYVDNDVLVYNGSEVGDFVVADMHTGRPIRRIHFTGHTKGLSVTRDHYLIGVSEYASRWARNTSRGHLVAIDRWTLNVVGSVDLNHTELPHPIGNVNEIRCLSEPEQAHACPHPPAVDLESLRLDPGDPEEQRWLRRRRAMITAVKTAKTGVISVRERARRAWRPAVAETS